MHMIVVCLWRNEMFCIHAYASHIIFFKKIQLIIALYVRKKSESFQFGAFCWKNIFFVLMFCIQLLVH